MKVFQKYALEFDGINLATYIDFSQYKVLNAGSSYTVVAWVKPVQENSDNGILANVVKDNIVLWKGVSFYGRLHFTIRKRNIGNVLYQGHYGDDNESTTPIVLGEWLMAGFVFDNMTRKQQIYINGQLDKERIASIVYKSDVYPIIGTISENDNELSFNGAIGELRIYNRPLTEEEIQYLYNGGHIEDGLVFWLYPDEDSVTLDTDGQTVLSVTEQINGYVGTAYNGVKLVDGKDVELNKRYLVVRKV